MHIFIFALLYIYLFVAFTCATIRYDNSGLSFIESFNKSWSWPVIAAKAFYDYCLKDIKD